MTREKPFVLGLTFFVVFILSSTSLSMAGTLSAIPFVGCAGGMANDPAPTGRPILLPIEAATAAKLALYDGEGLAVLAPRGWKCFLGPSPNLRSLTVYPASGSLHSGSEVAISSLSADIPNNDGLIDSYGGRYFPNLITKQDLGSDIEGHDSLWKPPYGQPFLFPYRPGDRISYVNPNTFLFQTPAFYPGLGPVLSDDIYLGFMGKTQKLPITGIMGISSSHGGPKELSFTIVVLPSHQSELTDSIINYSKICDFSQGSDKQPKFCNVEANLPDSSN